MTNAVSVAQSVASGVSLGFKNKIINGAMVIDQRNAGASVTQTTTPVYTVDRWFCYGTAGSKFTVQQNAGSVTPPAGFTKYLGCTSSSSYSVLTGDALGVGQLIEGLNVADLGWGTVNAQPITISFWVRSSLTGSFGGALQNAASNRSYPFSYTISAANTWEYKTISIAGDTSGTWLTTNGIGLQVLFTLGAGATYSGTVNTWAASNLWQPTGSTSVVGTNGATWYITGVQLEVGTQATNFEYRDYGRELIMCQRYCQVLTQGTSFIGGAAFSGSRANIYYYPPVVFRTNPSMTYPSVTGGNWDYAGSGFLTFTAYNDYYLSSTYLSFYLSGLSSAPAVGSPGNLVMASGQRIIISAEL